MSDFLIRQGAKTAKLTQLYYQPAQGFEGMGTMYVAEETISGETDVELEDGPATLLHEGKEWVVEVTPLYAGDLDEEGEEDSDETESGHAIEINSQGNLQELAVQLGLIED